MLDLSQGYIDVFYGHVRVVLANGRTEFPIQYSNGVIAYDHPELVPKDLKQQAARRFLQLKTNRSVESA